jgi:hypothetical protein
MSIMLADVPVPDREVLELTRRRRASGFLDTAEALELAYDSERRAVALTVPDREAIMRTLEDAPDELAELRGVLLREHEWRQREGLWDQAGRGPYRAPDPQSGSKAESSLEMRRAPVPSARIAYTAG